MRWYPIFLLAGTLLTGLASTNTATAADFSVTVLPSFLVLNTKPGETVTGSVRIQNNGTSTNHLAVDLLKIKPSTTSDNGQLGLELVAANDEFRSWVSFDTSILEIDPGRSQTVNVTITVPEHAALGYYYALALKDTDQVSGEDNTVVTGVTAVPILLEVVVSQAERSLTIVDFSATRRLYDFLPVTFMVTLKNTGNVHLAPRGNIFINRFNKNRAGDDLAILDVNNDNAGGYILPGTSRTFTSQWRDGFPLYDHSADGSGNNRLLWNLGEADKLRVGKFKATLVLVYDNVSEDKSVEGQVSFWVFPWQFVIAGIAALILLYNLKGIISGIKKRLRRLWRRPTKHE